MKSFAGLEIATSAVRVVEINRKPDAEGFVTIKRAAIEPFPSESPIVAGKIQDKTQVAHAIREALSAAGISRKGLVIGIASDALAAYLEIPSGAKDHEREYLIRSSDLHMWDVLDRHTSRISWRVVDKFIDGEERPREILGVAAVDADTVAALEDTLDLAQVRPAAIDLSGSALIRSLVRSPEEDRTVQTIIDIGAQQTLVVTRVGAHPRDIRTIGVGGSSITDAIGRTLKMAPAAAEEHKRHMQIPRADGLYGPMGAIPGLTPQSSGSALSEVEEALAVAADDLISAIAEVIDQDTAVNPSAPTQGALLVGGGSRLRGIRERVAARLGIPVHLGQPWVADKFTRETSFLEGNRRMLADLSIPIGLAMWGLVPRPSTDAQ